MNLIESFGGDIYVCRLDYTYIPIDHEHFCFCFLHYYSRVTEVLSLLIYLFEYDLLGFVSCSGYDDNLITILVLAVQSKGFSCITRFD